MQNIEYYQLIILIAQCLVVAAFLLLFFRLRTIFGLGLFYIAIGLFKFMHYFYTQAFSLEIASGIHILIGPTVITPAILFSLLLIYIREDAGEVRKIIYALIFFNFFFAVMLRISALGINGEGFVNIFNLPEHFFRMDIGSLIAGSLVLFIDGIVLIAFYEFISKKISSIFLRIFLTMTTVLFLHAFIFSSVAFIFKPVNTSILKGYAISILISKAISISVYTVTFWLYLVYFERRIANSKLTGSSFRDVFNHLTYRQKYAITYDKLIESEDKYKKLTENTSFGIGVSKDNKLIFANKKLLELFKVDSIDKFNEKPPLHYLTPESREMTKERIKKLSQGVEVSENFELDIVRADGEQRTLELGFTNITIDGEPCRLSTYNDITERKRAEEELRASEARLKQAEEIAHLGHWELDLKNSVLIWSDEVYRMFDLKPQEFESTYEAFLENIHPDDREKVNEAYTNSLKTKTNYEIEHRLLLKNGEVKYVLEKCQTEYDDTGEPIRSIGTVQDITEHKQAEEEILHLNRELEKRVKERTAQLEASNKELEAFAYSVSHDLRAPLRAIDGFTSILMKEYVENLDDEGKRLGDVIRNNAQKMGQLIDDLLAFSRLGRSAMRFSGIDMQNLATAIYHEVTSNSERHRIKFSVADLPDAYGDSTMLRQVWMNLISNAIKYSSKRQKAVISITGMQDDEKTTYSISDNGAGFDMQYVNKIFEVFQRLHTETEYPGTGVGLSLVQRIINRHNGKIWAESEIDKGATFYFSLPNKVD